MKIRILGCGAAGGVPMISRGWGACDPNNPKNKRLRTSLLIQHNGMNILVDTGPDLREQLLSANITALDAVLYTHASATLFVPFMRGRAFFIRGWNRT